MANDIWPDGWYVSDGEDVKGPFEADKVFNLIGNRQDLGRDENLIVSRRGFKKWYRLGDLEKLFIDNDYCDNDLEESLKEDLLEELYQVEAILTSVKEQSTKNVQQKIGDIPQKDEGTNAEERGLRYPTRQKVVPDKRSLQAITSKLAKKIAQDTPDLQDKKLASDTMLQKKEIWKHSEQALTAANMVKNYRPSEENSIAYYHMTLRGRLRLGDLKTPSGEMVVSLLTFGLISPFFIRRVAKEISWHVDKNIASKELKPFATVLMIVPILNIFYFSKLCQEIIKMEKQNSYRSTSVTLGSLLAITPPLACFYVQSKLNKHWRLHVSNVLKNKLAH